MDPTKVAQMVEVLKELTLVTPSAAPASLSTLNIMDRAMGTCAVHVVHGLPGYRARTQPVEPTYDRL